LAILVVGVGARVALMLYATPDQYVFSDSRAYTEAAQGIAAGHFSRDQFFQGIGYPLLLAATGAGDNHWTTIEWVHLVASIATLVLAWRCAATLVGERAALFAAAAIAVDVPLVAMASFSMPETVYAMSVTACLYLWLHGDGGRSRLWLFGFGLAAAVGGVLKGTILIILVPLAIYLFVVSKTKARAAQSLAVVGAGMATVILPLALYVHAHYGTYKVGADNAGFVFMDGKCPWKNNLNIDGTGWLSPLNVQLADVRTRTWTVPFSDSGYYFRAGLHCVKDDPIEVLRSLRYVYYLFFDNEVWPVNAGPLADSSRVETMLWRVVVFPGLALGILALACTGDKRRRLVWLSFVLAPCVVAYLLKSEARYRLPFDAVFVAVSTFGWKTVLSGLLGGLAPAALEVTDIDGYRRWEPRGRQAMHSRLSTRERASASKISNAA
jgi:4-amino-4-deoxy-L-arabinose transferase-like glycosyltransferase